MAKETIEVRILRNTRVKGEAVPAMVGPKDKQKQNVVKVSKDDAVLLVQNGKAEYVGKSSSDDDRD